MLNETSDTYMFQHGIMFTEAHLFLKNACDEDKSVREKQLQSLKEYIKQVIISQRALFSAFYIHSLNKKKLVISKHFGRGLSSFLNYNIHNFVKGCYFFSILVCNNKKKQLNIILHKIIVSKEKQCQVFSNFETHYVQLTRNAGLFSLLLWQHIDVSLPFVMQGQWNMGQQKYCKRSRHSIV